jgi:hypothetical protein
VTPIGNRTRDLPACSAVPQPTAPPRTPIPIYTDINNLSCNWRSILHHWSLYWLSYTLSCRSSLWHHVKHISIVFKQNTELLNVKTGGACSHRCVVLSFFPVTELVIRVMVPNDPTGRTSSYAWLLPVTMGLVPEHRQNYVQQNYRQLLYNDSRTSHHISNRVWTGLLALWASPLPPTNQPTKGLTRGRLVREAQSSPLVCFAIPACDRIYGLSNRLTILRQGLCNMLTGLCRSLGLQTGPAEPYPLGESIASCYQRNLTLWASPLHLATSGIRRHTALA